MPASDPTPLTATPSSAKALAAAGAGETAALRVSMDPPLPTPGFRLYSSHRGGIHVFLREECKHGEHGAIARTAPVAEGERVVVECPDCEGEGGIPARVDSSFTITREMALDAGDPSMEGAQWGSEEWELEMCERCQGEGTLPATVLATPTPEKCETCEDGKVWECDNHLCWMAVCPDCVGRLWGWRVEVRREGNDAGDE